MADAPGHLLGQIIGGVLEAALQPVLADLARKHDLYLDSQGERPGVRTGRKLTWRDAKDNGHDLDFVLERGGSAGRRGKPAAFVEAAWRRYTKHSKAKAQEISGALDPLLTTWATVKPTGAAVVAGEWTKPALAQLRSNGYVVLHFDFARTVAVFARHEMDIKGRAEGTEDAFWRAQCDTFLSKTTAKRAELAADFRDTMVDDLAQFAADLEKRVVRTIDHVAVVPVYGTAQQFADLTTAVSAIATHPPGPATAGFLRFEVELAFTNGESIKTGFATAVEAADFLKTFG